MPTAKLLADLDANGEQVEILVNNAGFGLIGRFAELDAKRQRQMIDLNVATLTDLTRAIAPQHGRPQVRARSSTSPRPPPSSPGPNMAVYFATKAYVLSFTEALHEELKPHGVQGELPLPRSDPHRIRRGRGLRRQRAFDRVAMDAPAVVAAGLRGLDRNRAVVVPGW